MVDSTRVQIGDIKPLGPVWPRRSIDIVKRKDFEQNRDDEQRNKHSRDEDDDEDKDGHAIDEFA